MLLGGILDLSINEEFSLITIWSILSENISQFILKFLFSEYHSGKINTFHILNFQIRYKV